MSEIYDIAVIGGGVNGSGIARDAAGRGAKTLLLEKGDLAQGTSSASTKLIHGGLRYLEHYEFALVRESLQEREVLWAIAPHIIQPLRFILPHRKGLRPRWLLRLGLFLYDHLGGRRDLPGSKSVNLQDHIAGKALKPGFSNGFAYSDGWVDDARLVVLNAMDAREHGADIRTQSPVTALVRADGIWKITAGGQKFRARTIVNATGPSLLSLFDIAGENPPLGMRLVRGSHIVTRKLFDHDFAYFFQLPDGRIFFAIPYEGDFTLIGTTDVDHKDGAAVQASAEEIDYLCEGANGYFGHQITADDVVWTYSGVRPLIDDGSGRPEAATRGYRLEIDGGKDDEAVLLSVFGGKITTYRHLAAEAVDLLARYVPAIQGNDWTGEKPLPGGDFAKEGLNDLIAELQRDYPFLDGFTASRIAHAYGTRVRQWLGAAKSAADLGTEFGHGLTRAEVDYLMEMEWALTVEDILWRRSKLGLRLDADEILRLETYLKEKGSVGS